MISLPLSFDDCSVTAFNNVCHKKTEDYSE